MEDVRPAPEPARPAAPGETEHEPGPITVGASPTRCPYCHDDVTAEAAAETALVCARCLSRHHAECWLTACASCGHERALAPAQAPAGVALEGAPYEAWKRRVTWGYLASFVLCLLAMPLGAALYPAAAEPPLLVMAPLGLCAALSMLMWAVNSYDALTRRQRRPETGDAPVTLALCGPLTGGLSTFIYFVTLGNQPLPPASPPSRRRPGAAKT